MSVVDSQSLEIWVQCGIPEEGELVFNVHFRNSRNIEWEVSYRLSQFGSLDVEINKRTDALRDVAFPTLSREAASTLASPAKYKNKLKDLEHCRMSLEQWVFYVVTRIEVVPDDLRDLVEGFFYLPGGPSGYQEELSTPMTPESGVNLADNGIASLSSLQVDPNSPGPISPSASFDDTASEYTVGSLDENGVPKKKKKRIIKGAKRRLSKAFGVGQKKEQFGVDMAGAEDGSSPKPTASSVLSGTSTVLSDSRSSTGGDLSPKDNKVQSVQPGKLIKVRVIRGGERSRGVPEYEIQLVYNPDKRPYTATHIYVDFSDLRDAVEEAKGVGVGASFPVSHAKSSLGFSLTEEQQAERTRLLDAWVKDLISSYQYMNDKERSLVRSFLNLDLSVQKDIYLQDKMANGMVEAPRAAVTGIASPTGLARNISGGKSESGSSRLSGGMSRDDASTSQVSGYSAATSRTGASGRPPVNRRGSTGGMSHNAKSPAERRAGYKVKIASTGSIGSEQKQPMRQKLNLRDMDGTVFTDENSVDSQSNLYPNRSNSAARRMESQDRQNTRASNLSYIEEERETLDEAGSSRLGPRPQGMLEENLLKIGMKEKPKKKKACCIIS